MNNARGRLTGLTSNTRDEADGFLQGISGFRGKTMVV